MAYTDDGGLHCAGSGYCQLLLDAASALNPVVSIAVCRRSGNVLSGSLIVAPQYKFQLAYHTIQSVAASLVALAQKVAIAICCDMPLLVPYHVDTHRKSFSR